MAATSCLKRCASLMVMVSACGCGKKRERTGRGGSARAPGRERAPAGANLKCIYTCTSAFARLMSRDESLPHLEHHGHHGHQLAQLGHVPVYGGDGCGAAVHEGDGGDGGVTCKGHTCVVRGRQPHSNAFAGGRRSARGGAAARPPSRRRARGGAARAGARAARRRAALTGRRLGAGGGAAGSRCRRRCGGHQTRSCPGPWHCGCLGVCVCV